MEDTCEMCGEDGQTLKYVAGVGLICTDCYEHEFAPPFEDPEAPADWRI